MVSVKMDSWEFVYHFEIEMNTDRHESKRSRRKNR